MHLETTRFGPLDISEESVITFPEGVIGFEGCKRYVILSKKDNAPLRWLQSLDEPGLAFIIISPYQFKPDYCPKLEKKDLSMLGVKSIKEAEVLAIVVVPENPRDMVANLMAPILINPKLCIGRQLIMQDSEYPTRYRILDSFDKSEEQNTVPC